MKEVALNPKFPQVGRWQNFDLSIVLLRDDKIARVEVLFWFDYLFV